MAWPCDSVAPHRPLVGHEDVYDGDVVAAAAPQPADVPGVDDLGVGRRKKEPVYFRGAVRVESWRLAIVDRTRADQPGRVAAAAREAPPPRQPEAARDRAGPASGPGPGPGDIGVRIAT